MASRKSNASIVLTQNHKGLGVYYKMKHSDERFNSENYITIGVIVSEIKINTSPNVRSYKKVVLDNGRSFEVYSDFSAKAIF